MADLFSFIESSEIPRVVTNTANDTWRPEAPPSLDGEKEIFVNFETSGLRWFEGDLPVAVTIYGKDRAWYLPFAHAGQGNLSEEQVYAFCQKELRDKLITNINTRFDTHMGRAWGEKMGGGGLDFEAMGCQVSDVAHYAALLDDHRYYTSLDTLIPEFLNEQPMVRLDESRMASYSAGTAAPRSMYGIEAVKRLKDAMWPMLENEGLQRVRQLEDDIIFVVCEMEKNGVQLDIPRLDQWIIETQRKYHQGLMELMKTTGLRVNPKSGPDQVKLFNYLKLPMTELTKNGQPSFTEEVLKPIKHPTIQLLRRTKKYGSLESKFRKYRSRVDSKGILRYALHQLRATKSDDQDAGETGTVTGRFTSTRIAESPDVGDNIQQVMKLEKQFLTYGDEFFVRELFLPGEGDFLSADAAQIQYRLFAHEAANPSILEQYSHEVIEDPKTWISFHRLIEKRIKVHKPDISYRRTKDTNFAKIFAAGPTKIALMLEFITPQQFKMLKDMKASKTHPLLATTMEILKIYDKEIPEVATLLADCTSLAEHRGYIKDILGRRMRFVNGQRSHKALNGRIQMSEASIVKTKMVELHKNRKWTDFLLRYQIHDEVDGDARQPYTAQRVNQILNSQTFPTLKVKILWEVKTGKTWGACSYEELAKLRIEAAKEVEVSL